MAKYKVDDKVAIIGKVQEIVENEEGIFYRLKVKHTGGSSVLNVEEQDIEGNNSSSETDNNNNNNNNNGNNNSEPTPDPEPEPTPEPEPEPEPEPTKYSVIFDANGGTFSDSSPQKTFTVVAGSTVTAPETPGREGYEFVKWKNYNSHTPIMGNTTIMAEWQEVVTPEPEPEPDPTPDPDPEPTTDPDPEPTNPDPEPDPTNPDPNSEPDPTNGGGD